MADKAIDRFEAKYIPEPNTGCWLWTGAISANGRSSFSTGKSWTGHRWAYRFYRGEIPEGKELDHLCRTPSCVNPFHLEAVTRAINVKRGWDARPDDSRRKTLVCHRGHLLAGDNVRIWIDPKSAGRRQICKHCDRDRARQYWRKKYGEKGNQDSL